MTVVILTSGTTWATPGNWNNASNQVECIGSGGGGSNGAAQDGAGGGGGYSSVSNITISGTITISIGVGGVGTASAGTAGPATYFNGASLAGSTVGAAGGAGGAGNSTVAAGGATASGTGTTKFAGGDGQIANDGGGGAGGPHGNGGTTELLGNIVASGSGGGGGGGGGNGVIGTATVGGAGGTNYLSAGAGAGGTSSVNPTSGSAGGGGGGGAAASAHATGAAGSNGTDMAGGSAGSGGGGGGSGSTTGNGGAGGLYGGGGGSANSGTAGGHGGAGVIVITYTPAATVYPFSRRRTYLRRLRDEPRFAERVRRSVLLSIDPWIGHKRVDEIVADLDLRGDLTESLVRSGFHFSQSGEKWLYRYDELFTHLARATIHTQLTASTNIICELTDGSDLHRSVYQRHHYCRAGLNRDTLYRQHGNQAVGVSA